MASLTSRVGAFRKTEHFSRLWKYASVSIISTGITQVVLFVCYGVIKIPSAMASNVIAIVIASVPAYYLNRNWTWGKTGKSDLWREIVPFWTISFVGLVLSTIAVGIAAHNNPFPKGSLEAALFVNFANLFSYGVIWIGRYVVFNKFMFGHHAAANTQILADEATNAVAEVLGMPTDGELVSLGESSRHPVREPADPSR